MKINVKEGSVEIDPVWIASWCALHYNVPNELFLAISWCADNEKRPTRRGLRRFLGAWIRRKCPVKPAGPVHFFQPDNGKPQVPLERRQEHLADLKSALKRRQPGEDGEEA